MLPSRLSLLALVAALGLLLAPHPALAGGRAPAAKPALKPLPPRTQKKADEVLSGATAAQKTKALASLQTAMSSRADLRKSTTKQGAFLKSSLAAQKGAAKRKPAVSLKKKGTQRTTTKKKGAAGGGAEEVAAAEVDDGTDDEGIDDDDSAGAPETASTSEGGLWGRFQRYRAARRTFRELAAADPELGQEVTLRARVRGSFVRGLFGGGGAAFAAFGIASGGIIMAAVGLGAAAFAGGREVMNRDRARKELVQEMAADGELEQQDIDTFQAAGWL